MTNDELTAIEQRAAACSDVPALVAEVRRLRDDLDRFTLTADEYDVIENLILRLRRTMIDGELYGIEEQDAQMRYALRSAFAPLMVEVRRLQARSAALERWLETAIDHSGDIADIEMQLRADIERIGRERDDIPPQRVFIHRMGRNMHDAILPAIRQMFVGEAK